MTKKGQKFRTPQAIVSFTRLRDRMFAELRDGGRGSRQEGMTRARRTSIASRKSDSARNAVTLSGGGMVELKDGR